MAIYANLYADQGSSFEATINVTGANGTAADLTGYTAAAQARRTYTSPTAFTFTATVAVPSEGAVRISMTDTVTDTMKGRYMYDVEITDSSGIVTRVIEGQYEVAPSITRS